MRHKPIGGELRHEERVAVLDDPADRSRLVAAIKAEAAVAIHCDLAGAEPFAAAVRGVGVCAGPGRISYFPGEDGLADLRPVLEDPAVHVYVHDAKAAWLALRRSGVRLTPHFDTMLAGYLLNPNRRSPALETLAQEYLAESLGHAPLEKKPKKGDLFEQPDPGETATRAARAASAIARLRPTLAEKLEAAGMRDLFERVELLTDRGPSKWTSPYVGALPLLVRPRTARLHPPLNQTFTGAGRRGSSEPNLQNIPVKGEWGMRIREAFVAEPGSLLLSADYNQIEPRILAHLSQDPVLIVAFARGDDIHTATAVEIFNLPAAQITKDMRRVAKTVNFGIIYRISPYGLSSQFGISQPEVKKYI